MLEENIIPQEQDPPLLPPGLPTDALPQPEPVQPTETQTSDELEPILAQEDSTAYYIVQVSSVIERIENNSFTRADVKDLYDGLRAATESGKVRPDVALRFSEAISAALVAVNESLAQENQRANKEAHTDSLTGLGNALALNKFLERNIGGKQTLVGFDAINFKAVNDLLSYETGNKVLKVIGQSISKVLNSLMGSDRSGFTTIKDISDDSHEDGYRAGGDEFYAAVRPDNVDLFKYLVDLTFRYGIRALIAEDPEMAKKVIMKKEGNRLVPYIEFVDEMGVQKSYGLGLRIATATENTKEAVDKELNRIKAEKKAAAQAEGRPTGYRDV